MTFTIVMITSLMVKNQFQIQILVATTIKITANIEIISRVVNLM